MFTYEAASISSFLKRVLGNLLDFRESKRLAVSLARTRESRQRAEVQLSKVMEGNDQGMIQIDDGIEIHANLAKGLLFRTGVALMFKLTDETSRELRQSRYIARPTRSNSRHHDISNPSCCCVVCATYALPNSKSPRRKTPATPHKITVHGYKKIQFPKISRY